MKHECRRLDEIDLCLVLSNLLENALESSLRTAPARRRIALTAYLHGNSLVLIQVENTYDGVIREKGGVFLSSKRKGDGVGIQSVRHIAEKSGGVSTVTYQDSLFLQRYLTSLRPNPSGRRSRQLKIHNPVTVPARFRYNFLSH